MRLYLIHCGFYDAQVSGGLFENHSNMLVCAEDFVEAREKAKKSAAFKGLKMHIDSMFEVEAVDGYVLEFSKRAELEGKSRGRALRYGSRAPQTVEF